MQLTHCLNCTKKIPKSKQKQGLRIYCTKCSKIVNKKQISKRVMKFYIFHPEKKYRWCKVCQSYGMRRKIKDGIKIYHCKNCNETWSRK